MSLSVFANVLMRTTAGACLAMMGGAAYVAYSLLAPMTRPLQVPRAEAPPVVVLVPDRPRPPDPPPVEVAVVRFDGD